MGDGAGSDPLPENRSLADVAIALRDTGHWGWVVDHRWHTVYMTDELRRTFGAGDLADHGLGTHFFGPETVEASRTWRFGPNTDDHQRTVFSACGNLVLADADGDRDAVRAAVDPLFHDLVESLEPSEQASVGAVIRSTKGTGSSDVHLLVMRVTDVAGERVGYAIITKPPIGMMTMSSMLDDLDPGHLERMQHVARPARRPAAILFADLEGSSQLARSLPTRTYFSLGRRLVRAADRCVINAGGLVGRHVGDGVVAFFLVETAGSESAARAPASPRLARCEGRSTRWRREAAWIRTRWCCASGCIGVRRSTSATSVRVDAPRSRRWATRSTRPPASRRVRPAAGSLASKDLIERLDHDDAADLGLDPLHLAYTTLRDLDDRHREGRVATRRRSPCATSSTAARMA